MANIGVLSANLRMIAVANTRGCSFLYNYERDGLKLQDLACKKSKVRILLFQILKRYIIIYYILLLNFKRDILLRYIMQ